MLQVLFNIPPFKMTTYVHFGGGFKGGVTWQNALLNFLPC